MFRQHQGFLRKMYKKRFLLLVCSIAISGLMVGIVSAAPGDLDTTFDTDGIVVYGGSADENLARDVIVQPDGKIIVPGMIMNGSTLIDAFLVRFCPNGSLDDGNNCGAPGFGSGGVVSMPSGFNYNTNQGFDIALQDDDKVIVSGQILVGADYDAVTMRYCPDGSLDDGSNCGGGFGVGGMATYTFGSGIDSIDHVAVQTDGKIVVSGSAYDSSLAGPFVIRYCADGILDDGVNCGGSGFGTGGVFDVGLNMYSNAIALQDDGKILLIAYDGNLSGSLLVRLCPDGNLDNGINCGGSGFGDFGNGLAWIQTERAEISLSLAIQSDGRILVAGFGGEADMYYKLYRFCPSGTLDDGVTCGAPGFGIGGIVNTIIDTMDAGYDVAIQADGKIVLAGTSNDFGDNTIGLVRYCSNGDLDDGINCGSTGFGNGGIATSDVHLSGRALDLQPADGKIVVAGEFFQSSNQSDIMTARYEVASTVSAAIAAGDSASLNEVTIANNGTTSCTFTVIKNPVPPGGMPIDSGEMPIQWNITTDCTTYNLDLTFQYTDAELANTRDVSEVALVAFRNSTGGENDWVTMGGIVDLATNTVTVNGVTALSAWTLGDPLHTPTALNLVTFSAETHHDWISILSILVLFGLLLMSSVVIFRNIYLRKLMST